MGSCCYTILWLEKKSCFLCINGVSLTLWSWTEKCRRKKEKKEQIEARNSWANFTSFPHPYSSILEEQKQLFMLIKNNKRKHEKNLECFSNKKISSSSSPVYEKNLHSKSKLQQLLFSFAASPLMTHLHLSHNWLFSGGGGERGRRKDGFWSSADQSEGGPQAKFQVHPWG